MLAVSQNVMPSSTACRNMGSAASSPSAHSLKPREVSPKLMQPSAMRLTFRPVLPRCVYSMVGLLPLDGPVRSGRVGQVQLPTTRAATLRLAPLQSDRRPVLSLTAGEPLAPPGLTR